MAKTKPDNSTSKKGASPSGPVAEGTHEKEIPYNVLARVDVFSFYDQETTDVGGFMPGIAGGSWSGNTDIK